MRESLLHLVNQLGLGHAHDLGEPIQRVASVLIIADRSFAGDRLNAPHAGGNAALVDDLEQADIARAPHVSSAAQLFAEIRDIDNSNLIAILLAEQRHCARTDRLV